MILHYSPLVKYVASRVAVGLPQNVEQADLVSYGMFGLIDAIDKFEPGRGFKFETYAISRIKGAILDELRSIDWVPRSVRAKVRCHREGLRQARGEATTVRPPTRSWPPSWVGPTSSSSRRCSQISTVGLAALDEILVVGGDRGETLTLGDTIADASHGPMGAFEVAELRQLLAQAINGMPEREKIVLTLYYYENLTLQEIGKVLGVTESRVCQIHTKAVLQLRHRLAGSTANPHSPPPTLPLDVIVCPRGGVPCVSCHRSRSSRTAVLSVVPTPASAGSRAAVALPPAGPSHRSSIRSARRRTGTRPAIGASTTTPVPGDPVLAIGAGTVVFAGLIAHRRYVTVHHPDGLAAPTRSWPSSPSIEARWSSAGSASVSRARPSTSACAGATSYLDPARLFGRSRAVLVPRRRRAARRPSRTAALRVGPPGPATLPGGRSPARRDDVRLDDLTQPPGCILGRLTGAPPGPDNRRDR